MQRTLCEIPVIVNTTPTRGDVAMAEKTNDAAGFVLFNENEEVLLVHQQYGKNVGASRRSSNGR
jgi:hypothetical protein